MQRGKINEKKKERKEQKFNLKNSIILNCYKSVKQSVNSK